MKSPSCDPSSSPIGVASDNGSLAILSTCRTFPSGIWSFSAISPGVGSRPVWLSRRRLVRRILLSASTMCTGMRMVRAWSAVERPTALADPPDGVGPELVATPVIELVDRLHLANISFLDQIEELQAAISIFLRYRDDQAQICLDHFLLCLVGLALTLLHHAGDASNLADFQAGLAGERIDL